MAALEVSWQPVQHVVDWYLARMKAITGLNYSWMKLQDRYWFYLSVNGNHSGRI